MKKIIVFLAMAVLASTAVAQPYVLGGIATTKVSAGGLQDDATRLNLALGYKVGKLGAEVGCVGSADCSISGVGWLPIAGGFSLVGKAGVHRLKGSVDGPSIATGPDAGGFAPASSQRESWSGFALGAGLGVEYAGAKGVGVRLMLEQTGSVGRLDHARSISATLLYPF